MQKGKRLLAIIAILLLSVSTAWALPWITQGLNIIMAAGKTLTVSNTMTLTATDGSTLAIGAGGTLGSAAYTASTAYAPAYVTAGGMTCTALGNDNICGYAAAILDEGTVTLPTVTANYSGHGFVRTSSAGVINDSAEFEVGSDGNVSLIRGTANVVVGAACADTKICISTAAGQNPVIVQARNGAEQVEIEFWYH